jgi:hypothetical protein
MTVQPAFLVEQEAVASLALRFTGVELSAIEFRRDRDTPAVLTSPTRGGRYARIRWGDQMASVVLFALHQAHWMTSDPERAAKEIRDAVAADVAVPASAPDWYADLGPFVATAAEAVKKRFYNGLAHVFGTEHLKFVKRAFPYKKDPPSIWHDRRTRLAITVYADGGRVTDPRVIVRLMEAVAGSRGWSIEKLVAPDARHGSESG